MAPILRKSKVNLRKLCVDRDCILRMSGLEKIEEASEIFSLALKMVKEISDFEMIRKCDALAEIGAGYHIAGLRLKDEDKAVLRKLVLKAYPLKLFWERETQNSVFRDLIFLVSPLRRGGGPQAR